MLFRVLCLALLASTVSSLSLHERINKVNEQLMNTLQVHGLSQNAAEEKPQTNDDEVKVNFVELSKVLAIKPADDDVPEKDNVMTIGDVSFLQKLAIQPSNTQKDQFIEQTVNQIHNLLAIKPMMVVDKNEDEELPTAVFIPPAPKMEFATVEAKPAPPVPSDLASYAFAVDFSSAASVSSFTCLRNAGYGAAFVRAYNPVGNGAFDSNVITNINNAYSAGLGLEIYMTPQPKSTKQGYQQLDEVYNGLTSKGVNIRAIWIQVTSPVNWGASINTNINFINSIVARARQYGLSVGIYTSSYDWNQITNGWTGVGNDVMLWYWSVNGGGTSGETPANFNDFRAFGCWTAPTVKQFAQVETVCSLTVNRDVYTAGSKAAPEGMAHREKAPLAVGGIGLH